ncbi:MAG: CoA activase, partial [Deltaproteobacteria bacterium]|nr:CoA activase [Deltaproteobacteria bacterium]
MSRAVSIGMDIGSVAVKVVCFDPSSNIILERYERTMGCPLETTLKLLGEVVSSYGREDIQFVSATGSGGNLIAQLIGAYFCNEVIAQSRAIAHFHPEVRTIVEMGGQDAKLIMLGSGGCIEDFQMNSVCAAGTGSFLDQQAVRMGFTIEEFGGLALKSENPPRIAGRCSVFAKTDMIHLQQIATPVHDIVAGLCYAVARNFKSTIGKGKEFLRPVSFHGGVAANPGVRKAFKEVLELGDSEYIVPEHFASMGAIGALLTGLDKNKGINRFKGLSDLERHIKEGSAREDALNRLDRPEGHPSQKRNSAGYRFPEGKKIHVYMGLDVGSTSTNVVLIDKDSRLVAKRYLATAGRPLEAVRQGLKEIAEECAEFVEVAAVGTTGSGRYLTGDFVGADIVRNEITAQATAASAIDPLVDTVFEIGGQDSKYIAISDGVVVDFEMNKVCAAGTGSFLEEQAERLGISIKKEFGDMAIGSSAPAKMGERCTVFIESDMVHHQQRGVGKDDIVAGLAYSIAHNYLNRVVGDRRIGERIFFQGGTAANLAVISAFERITGKRIVVPEHHDVTGAIGVAILAIKEKDPSSKTIFKGFDLSRRPYELRSFVCRDCANVCEIREVVIKDERSLYYGGRCEKYDMKAAQTKTPHLACLFKEREKILFSSYTGMRPARVGADAAAPKIGLPRALFNYEMYPFWKAFFTELGYRV